MIVIVYLSKQEIHPIYRQKYYTIQSVSHFRKRKMYAWK